MAGRRTFLGKRTTVGRTTFVYQTDHALEVDDLEYFFVRRTRLFFDELQLVTHHQTTGALFVVVCGMLAVLVGLVSVLIGTSGDWLIGGIVFAMLGLPVLLVGLLRLILKVDVVTAYGKRGSVQMEFAFRKGRAREVYQLIARLGREHQERLARELAAEERREASAS